MRKEFKLSFNLTSFASKICNFLTNLLIVIWISKQNQNILNDCFDTQWYVIDNENVAWLFYMCYHFGRKKELNKWKKEENILNI